MRCVRCANLQDASVPLLSTPWRRAHRAMRMAQMRMGTRDPRIDQYIARQAEFARPILTHLREVVHSACPDVEEATKWGAPFFMYHGPLCSMAGFKQHCAFAFWKGALVVGRGAGEDDRAAGQFGRITSVKDLPSKKELSAYIKKAMQLNEEGVAVPQAKKARPQLPVP